MDDLLAMINHGNKANGGLVFLTEFAGLFGTLSLTEKGFTSFLQDGLYLILITKISPVALLGGFYIYHIDATVNLNLCFLLF